jgi:hypothetical protein
MNRAIYLLIGIILTLSTVVYCKREPKEIQRIEVQDKVRIITFDSCQYIYVPKKSGLAHKGNCKNTIHK